MHTTPPTLLDRLREAGDESAWSRLVELYTPLMYTWARRCGESAEDAADLIQEVFVALVQTLPSFEHRRTGAFRK
jgi:RNA polymerase sigma-70 factor (ECF subfamily)